MNKIFLIAGEPSGDLQGSLLAKEFKKIKPDLELQGLGGDLMQSAGVKIYYNLAKEAIVGFGEVIKKINFFRKIFKDILGHIKQEQPDAVIFIDFPGFNLRLVKEVKKLKIKTIYYISPQIWAWGERRVEIIRKYLDEMIVFFKFEEEFYKRHNVKTKFVGHPFLDLIQPNISKDKFIEKYNLNPSARWIFLMPGSRDNEFKKHLPPIIKAISELSPEYNLEFLLLKSSYLKKNIPLTLPNLKIISNDNYNAIHYSYAGIVASGTATLEAAILDKPFIIIYKTSSLNYLILKPQVKVPYIGMANIILKEKAMPELIQNQCRAQNIKTLIEKFLSEPLYYNKLKNKLLKLRSELGEKGAVQRAAQYILQSIKT